MPSKYVYSILLHYSEIALKLKNRKYFERIFIKNIILHIKGLEYSEIKLISARVFIHNINFDEWDEYKKRLKNLMGLQHATLMIKTDNDLNEIKLSANQLIKNNDFSSFRITTKRNNKKYKYNSNEVSIEVGDYVQKISKKPVNLNYPDLLYLDQTLAHKEKVNILSLVFQ